MTHIRAPRTVAVLVCTLCIVARAQAAEPPEKRELPDYDGREEPTTAGDVLIWIPRVLLSPLYLVSEYVVRRPLGFLLTEAERANVPAALYAFFTFGPDHSAGVFPIAFVDFGFEPSVGLYFFWDDVLVEHHDLRLRASTWGSDWLAARLTDRWHLVGVSSDTHFTLDASAVRRPDYVFHGLGPRTLEADESRYGADTLAIEVRLDHGFWRASRMVAATGVRSADFYESFEAGEVPLEARVRAGAFDEPPGYDTGYTLVYSKLELAIDSRRERPAPGSGVRLELHAENDADVRSETPSGFVRWGGGLGGFYDLDDHGRVVSLSAQALFADPLRDAVIPFTELVGVGGTSSMRGFVPGRLYDRSAAFATLRYRWPIWILLDGSIQIAVGNAFGPRLRGLQPGLMRLSVALGIESVGSPDSSFELLVGMGTETFDSGAEVTSVRVVAGTNHGF